MAIKRNTFIINLIEIFPFKIADQDVRLTGQWIRVTCCDHRLETGLLVDARPNDVASFGSPVTKGQEAESQTHPCSHGYHEAAGHTPDTCNAQAAHN